MPVARIHLCLVAAASIAIVAPALAKPAKHPEPVPARSQKKRLPLVLASADALPAQAPKPTQNGDGTKVVTPRVTTCRCGDPDAAEAAINDQ